MMRLGLTHAGYAVEVASDGHEGLDKFGNGEGWDLVLLDQRMPGMSGIEVQREIYAKKADAKLILITAFGTIDLAMEAIQAGASDFLRKPFTSETLRVAVESALGRVTDRSAAVPVGTVCREFTRSTINGFAFELESDHVDDATGDIVCNFHLHRANDSHPDVHVHLPVIVQELIKAYIDCEKGPGGHRFWQAICEEALADYLWQNAQVPPHNTLRIDDLSPTLERWLDSMLTVNVGGSDAR